MEKRGSSFYKEFLSYLFSKIGFDVKLLKGFSVYAAFLSFAFWIFVYSYTKSFFKAFNYKYFVWNTYDSMFEFFFNSIEVFTDFIPFTLIVFLILIGISVVVENHKYEDDKPFLITRFSIVMLLLCPVLSITQFLFIIRDTGDIWGGVKLLIVDLIIVLMIVHFLRKKKYIVMILFLLISLIAVFANGKAFGGFMAKDIQITKEKVYMKTKEGVKIKFKDAILRNNNKIKYLIGKNEKYTFLCIDSLIKVDTIDGEIIQYKKFKVSSINNQDILEKVFKSEEKKIKI